MTRSILAAFAIFTLFAVTGCQSGGSIGDPVPDLPDDDDIDGADDDDSTADDDDSVFDDDDSVADDDDSVLDDDDISTDDDDVVVDDDDIVVDDDDISTDDDDIAVDDDDIAVDDDDASVDDDDIAVDDDDTAVDDDDTVVIDDDDIVLDDDDTVVVDDDDIVVDDDDTVVIDDDDIVVIDDDDTVVIDDDDTVVIDDDDIVVDDDDIVFDDDDIVVDDDDTVVIDDDDIVVDDDDIVVDDDDIVVIDDDDIVVIDDDDIVVIDDDDIVVIDDDDIVVDDDDIVADDDDTVLPTCPADLLACDGPLSHTWNNSAAGSTAYMTGYSCLPAAVHTGPEYHYSFTAPAEGEFFIETTGTSADLDVYVLEGTTCDLGACVEDSSSSDGDEELSFDADAGDTFVIVVDGWDGAISDYTITLTCELDTGDDDDDDDDDAVGTDDDGDGFPTPDDCDDDDPDIHPGADEECDTVDNDCDGQVDEDACLGCQQASYGGHSYQFCDDLSLDWQDADWACQISGYELTTVDSQGENDFLALQAGTGNWWIGYNDRGGWSNEDNFVWSGAPSTTGWENWAAGEPNNAGPSWSSGEDCVELREDFGWQWNDAPCYTIQHFVCEAD